MERVLPRALTDDRRSSLRQHLLQLRLIMSRWQQRVRTRRRLAALDDRQLADIGISRSERQEELDKPFWR